MLLQSETDREIIDILLIRWMPDDVSKTRRSWTLHLTFAVHSGLRQNVQVAWNRGQFVKHFSWLYVLYAYAQNNWRPVKLFLAQARPGVLFLAASGLPRKWCPNWRLGQSWGRFVFLPEVTRNFFGPPQTQSNPQNAHEYIVSIVDVGHWSIENLNLDFCSLFFYLCLLPKPQLLFSTIFAYSFGLYTRNLTNGVWRMA